MNSENDIAHRITSEIASRESQASPASADRIRLAMVAGRRQRTVRRLGMGGLVVALTAGIALPLAMLAPIGDRTANHASSATADRFIRLESLPAAWSVSERLEPIGVKVIAANYATQLAQKETSAVAVEMPTNGILLSVQQISDACPCTGLRESTLPLSIEADEIDQFGPHGYTLLTLDVDSVPLALYAEFGSFPVGPDQLDELNGVLSGLTFASSEPPISSNAIAAPVFSGQGLNVATTPTYPHWEGSPITWASNSPFAAEDLGVVARTGILPFRPETTLVDLPASGFVIVATRITPDPTSPPGPNQNFIPSQLPLRIADADIRGTWEGQVAERIPEYLLLAYVNGQYLDVRVYFGTPHPSEQQLADVQAALDSIQLG